MKATAPTKKAAPRARSANRRAELMKLDVVARVRRASAFARDLLIDGLDDSDGTLYGRIEEHVGIQTPIKLAHEDELWKLVAVGEGAFAIGIAVGLLLRPDAFTGGDR